ncbi:MAG: hypothetical protein AAGC70_06415 [Pseudomonadota bacterium]
MSEHVTHIPDLGALRYVHIASETGDIGTEIVACHNSKVSFDQRQGVVAVQPGAVRCKLLHNS